jgi:hypothetical protein
MPILLSHPVGDPARGTREVWERQILGQIRDALGSSDAISLTQPVVEQLRRLAWAPPSPARDGMRDRGASFAPCFHIVVADKAQGNASDWRLSTQRSMARALLPGQAPAPDRIVAASDVSITLGFAITLPELMLFGSLGMRDGSKPHLTFNVLAPQSRSGHLETPVIRKTGVALAVALPGGRSIDVPPALAAALREYVKLISGETG